MEARSRLQPATIPGADDRQDRPIRSRYEAPSPVNCLTAREASVLELVALGQTSREIGVALRISARTVEFHRANIMGKLSARGVVELMRVVFRPD